jgi:hypothetical protein
MPVIVAVVCALSAPPAVAQSSDIRARGTKIIDGSASIMRTETSIGGTSARLTTVMVAPSVLCFTGRRFALGSSVSMTRASTNGGSLTSWAIGPVARMFFGSSPTRLPFVGARLLVGGSNASGSDASDGQTTFGGEGSAGITHMLSAQVGLTTDLFWLHTRMKSDDAPDVDRTNTYGLRVGVTAFLR